LSDKRAAFYVLCKFKEEDLAAHILEPQFRARPPPPAYLYHKNKAAADRQSAAALEQYRSYVRMRITPQAPQQSESYL